MPVLIVLLVLIVLVGIVIGVAALINRSPQPRPSRTERAQVADLQRRNRELSQLVARIDKLAYDNRMLDPELSTMIVDEISKYKGNELA